LQRSLDNTSFNAIGYTVHAAGNSSIRKEYQEDDNISSLSQHAVIYYRVKLIDIDGRFKYSNVVVLRLSQKPGVTIWPNPFQSSISVSITTTIETIIDIRLIDVSGKILRSGSQPVPRGMSKISFDDLEQLPAGAYLIEINDRNAGVSYQKVIKNEKR
jgi:Secretion system C-terminal sorting domain